MNIIIATNKNYIEPTKAMLFSLHSHNNTEITIYLLHSSLEQNDINDLSAFARNKCNFSFKPILIDRSLFNDAPKNKWWSEETYYRLLAFDLLPKTEDRALWLDGDIIIKGNIEDFYNQNLESHYAAVCEGCNQTGIDRLNLPSNHIYFNAGVILFNLAEIRNYFSPSDIFNIIKIYKDKLLLLDQDVLNLMFTQKLKYCNPQIYNNETYGEFIIPKEKMNVLKKNAKIIHYTGPIKPWNPNGLNWADSYFWKSEFQRGKFKEFLCYKIKNAPLKIKCIVNEVKFIIISFIKKVKG